MRLNYEKSPDREAAYRILVSGVRAIFNHEKFPRAGLFWGGIKKLRVRCTEGGAPLLLHDVKSLLVAGPADAHILASSTEGGPLPRPEDGLGDRVEADSAIRAAPNDATAFSRVSRALEGVQIAARYLLVDADSRSG